MLGKALLMVKSKVALAVLGLLVAGTGGTAALAATGHMPTLPALPNATHSANDQSDNGNHGHTVAIEGTLKGYDAGAKTISVLANGETSETTIGVNDQTRVNGYQASQLSDLTASVGHKVQVQATKQDDGSLVAWKITVEGATDDNGHNSNAHRAYAGTITSVTTNGFVMTTADGTKVTVVTGAQTSLTGAVSDLAKIAKGMRVEVQGDLQSDGSILASSVRVENAGQSGDHGGH